MPPTANIRTNAAKAIAVTQNAPNPSSPRPALYMNSFPIKPIIGGMPAMLIAASAAASPVSGIAFDRPPRTPASRVPVA